MALQLAPLLSELTIQTKDLRTVKFPIHDRFAWAQRAYLKEIERQYNSGKPVRIIVLKARQLGISTATEGVLFWWSFIHPGTNGLVIAHESDASASLFEKTQLYWDTWPFKDLYKAKYASLKRFTWEPNRSTLRVATAKNVESGRSRTLHAVHASECAFYPDPKTLMLGLRQTIPNEHGTIVVLESTANGIGTWFHDEWLAAEEGESDYVGLFFPWFKHYEYSMHTTLCTALELDVDERNLIKVGCTYENIEWRRWAIKNLADNDPEAFKQEYPATPHEAFITSGTNVFPLGKLDECYQPMEGFRGTLINNPDNTVRWVADPTGPLKVFKAPTRKSKNWQRYFVSGDPSMTVEGDPACIQVLNRTTLEQVAVWHGRCDPITFAKEMMKIGRWYHEAELCPEIEGGGQAAIATMINFNYPNLWRHTWADKEPGKVSTTFGWSTNYNRKRWAVGRLKYLLVENSIIIHDKKTYNQLRNFIVLSSGEMGNASRQQHDDAVSALSIGVTASHTEPPLYEEEHSNQENLVNLFEDIA
jgi:hypothetical protein